MRLYSANSPNSLKVRLALEELGVEHERTSFILAKGEHRTPEFEAINPHLKVPVLEVDGVHIAESGAIVQHLGRTRGGDLWPRQPADDAVLSRWLFLEAAHLAGDCGALWFTDVLATRHGLEPAKPSRNDAAVENLPRPLDVLESMLASRATLSETGFTLADVVVGATLSMLCRTRLDPADRWPALAAYAGRLHQRPSWAAAEGPRCLHWE